MLCMFVCVRRFICFIFVTFEPSISSTHQLYPYTISICQLIATAIVHQSAMGQSILLATATAPVWLCDCVTLSQRWYNGGRRWIRGLTCQAGDSRSLILLWSYWLPVSIWTLSIFNPLPHRFALFAFFSPRNPSIHRILAPFTDIRTQKLHLPCIRFTYKRNLGEFGRPMTKFQIFHPSIHSSNYDVVRGIKTVQSNKRECYYKPGLWFHG